MANTFIFIGKYNVDHFEIFNEFPLTGTSSEYFKELIAKPFPLNLCAETIEQLDGLSVRAKILLSACLASVIQHMIENNIDFSSDWEIYIEKEEEEES